MRRWIGLAVAMMPCATPALGGGPVRAGDDPAATLPDRDWQSAFVGISFGTPTGDNVFGRSDLDIWSRPADWSGSPVALKAGYDWQRGRLVYGLALDLYAGDISNPTRPSDTVICFVDCEIGISNLTTLRARIGYSFGKTLVYALAGLSRAEARFTAIGGVTTLGVGTLDGWTAGLGVEHRIGTHMSLSAEYRQTDLGVLPLDCFPTCQTAIRFGTAELGITYRW